MNLHGFGDRDGDGDVERGVGAVQAGEPLSLLCGEKVRVSTLKPAQYLLLCCCPCCLGPPCSRCVLPLCSSFFFPVVAATGAQTTRT